MNTEPADKRGWARIAADENLTTTDYRLCHRRAPLPATGYRLTAGAAPLRPCRPPANG